MALARVVSSFDTLPVLSRISCAGNLTVSQRDDRCCSAAALKHLDMLHVTSARSYPDVPFLPLPTNMSEIFANETGRFTPERSRDIGAPDYLYSINRCPKAMHDQSSFSAASADTHVDSYDCFGAISLNGAMQSNVPKPYRSYGKSMYLNMPGGQWARDGKYIAERMQKSHYRSLLFGLPGQGACNGHGCVSSRDRLLRNAAQPPHYMGRACYSISLRVNGEENVKNAGNKKLSRAEVMKKYCKEYGKTFIVFHIGVSLISLGGFYAAVSSGVDLSPFTNYWLDTLSVEEKHRDLIRTSTDFALAYLIHKVIFPLRLLVTISATPLIATHRVWRAGPTTFDPSVNPPVHPKLKKLKQVEGNGLVAPKNVGEAKDAQ